MQNPARIRAISHVGEKKDVSPYAFLKKIRKQNTGNSSIPNTPPQLPR